jgi:flavin reductase (DIM6/NTAB) family NADH-FMN oxidoreductase RutF
MKQTNAIPAGTEWKEKDIREFSGSTVGQFCDNWALITAGQAAKDKTTWTTMTAAWGGLGELWGLDVGFIFIHPDRYTWQFASEAPLFTMSFFDEKYKQALNICGTTSGRDTDKAAETGLTPIVFSGNNRKGQSLDGAVAFKEASQNVICRKIYTHDFTKDGIADPALAKTLCLNGRYHRMFIGEVLALMV